MKCHWVGHSKIKPLDVDKLFNITVIINELGASVYENDETEALFVAWEAPEKASVNLENLKEGGNNYITEETVDSEEIYEEPSGDTLNIDVQESVHIEAALDGAKDYQTNYRTPEYKMEIYLYVQDINKNDKNTQRKIYDAINEPHFEKV